MELLQIMKAMADETRLRILNVLRKKELCVCEIEYLLEISQSNVSRHLNKLWNCRLIVNEKKAQWVFYRINEDILRRHPFIEEILDKELKKLPACKEDLERFEDYRNSDLTCDKIKAGFKKPVERMLKYGGYR